MLFETYHEVQPFDSFSSQYNVCVFRDQINYLNVLSRELMSCRLKRGLNWELVVDSLDGETQTVVGDGDQLSGSWPR